MRRITNPRIQQRADTAYRADCDAIFGRFLDHFPYFGMRDEHDARDLEDAYTATLERYHDAFGEPPQGTWISTEILCPGKPS